MQVTDCLAFPLAGLCRRTQHSKDCHKLEGALPSMTAEVPYTLRTKDFVSHQNLAAAVFAHAFKLQQGISLDVIAQFRVFELVTH